MTTTQVLTELLAIAGLPSPRSVEGIGGGGLDNVLHRAELADGRQVLLREHKQRGRSPRPRADFLSEHRVGAPRLHAANDRGDTLVEYIEGMTLADAVHSGAVSDKIWNAVGASLAAVHAVRFPKPLQGEIGPDTVTLSPEDPVEQLQTRVDEATTWVRAQREHIFPLLDRLRNIISSYAHEIRAHEPCLVHGDINLDNVIVNSAAATLIDWDYPAVRYPIDELSALDEHLYLNNMSGIPDPFWTGYGRRFSWQLLLLYRVVGCLGWLSSDDWTIWATDNTIEEHSRARLDGWHRHLLRWIDDLPQHLDTLTAQHEYDR